MINSLHYLAPSGLSLTLPIALVIAVVITFGALGDQNEFAATKAAGVSPYWLVCPVIVVGVLLRIGPSRVFDSSDWVRCRFNGSASFCRPTTPRVPRTPRIALPDEYRAADGYTLAWTGLEGGDPLAALLGAPHLPRITT